MICHVGLVCSCVCTGLAQYSLFPTDSAIFLRWWYEGFAGLSVKILLWLGPSCTLLDKVFCLLITRNSIVAWYPLQYDHILYSSVCQWEICILREFTLQFLSNLWAHNTIFIVSINQSSHCTNWLIKQIFNLKQTRRKLKLQHQLARIHNFSFLLFGCFLHASICLDFLLKLCEKQRWRSKLFAITLKWFFLKYYFSSFSKVWTINVQIL